VAIADEDGTDRSRAFVARLAARPELDLARATRDEGLTEVRGGRRSAAIVVPPGFGEAAGRMFYGTPPTLDVYGDPSRQAETGMLEGLLFQEAAQSLQTLMSDPAASRSMVDEARRNLQLDRAMPADRRASLERFLGELDQFLGQPQAAVPAVAPAWQPLVVRRNDLVRERRGPSNAFDVTFPQAILWGIIGCVMTFAIGLVVERTRGTLLRLRASPLTNAQLLGGKAVACFAAILLVEAALLALGRVAFGVRPLSYGLLMLASVSTAVAFVGLMMLISSFGRTEQAAAGVGWAAMMPMAMLGGAMVPLFIMPAWMVTLGHVSPVKWAILALEGAIWRGFSLQEMLQPCGILIAVGVVSFAIGTRAVRGL
jgi:ABC-2 type transport system permease protein